MSDIQQWLDSLGLGQYAEAFEENEIDLEVIPRLERESAVTYPCDASDRPGNDIVFAGGVPEGMVFIPFCYAEAPANVLTNPALDPFGKIPEFKFRAAQVEAADEAA